MMRSSIRILLFVLLLLLALVPAKVYADTVNLTLVNTLPNNSAGGVYVYPYNFSINGSKTLTALLCDDYLDEVKLGESWNANVNTLAAAAAGAGHFGITNNYYKAGWLYEQLLANAPNASPEAINWAIWKVMSPSITVPSSVLGSSSTAGTVAWWLAQIPGTIDPNSLNNIVVYTWDGNTSTLLNGPGHPPQEYFGSVPEPATITLILTGGGIFLRRRKRR
ncbi:MAG: PEP-CTERM sorting domain-containing protein [Terriglobales bacterium]